MTADVFQEFVRGLRQQCEQLSQLLVRDVGNDNDVGSECVSKRRRQFPDDNVPQAGGLSDDSNENPSEQFDGGLHLRWEEWVVQALQHNVGRGVQLHISEFVFVGELEPEGFFDSLDRIENYFDWKGLNEERERDEVIGCQNEGKII